MYGGPSSEAWRVLPSRERGWVLLSREHRGLVRVQGLMCHLRSVAPSLGGSNSNACIAGGCCPRVDSLSSAGFSARLSFRMTFIAAFDLAMKSLWFAILWVGTALA